MEAIQEKLNLIEAEMVQVYDSIPREEVLGQMNKDSKEYSIAMKKIARLNELRLERFKIIEEMKALGRKYNLI